MSVSVSVLGAGAGGLAISADLARSGHEVTLFETAKFKQNLSPIRKRGGILLTEGGKGRERFVPLARATDRPREAVRGADLVLIAVPCFAHETFARTALPHLKGGQSVVFLGEGSGSLVFDAVRRKLRKGRGVVVGETNTLPFSARVIGPGRVRITLKKTGGVICAALPASETGRLLSVLRPLFPVVRPATNVLETMLVNFNAIDHVATVLANAGQVEGSNKVIRLWGDGATPAVARCIETVDREILAVRKALGFKNRTPYKDWVFKQGFLKAKKRTVYETIHGSGLARAEFQCGPHALRHRFIAEDVPYALVLISSIARVTGVEVPLIDGLIAMASAMNGVDYRKQGRTLEGLGIRAKTKGQLLSAVN